MESTYWNGNGRFEEQSRQVRALGLIPQEGEAVDPLAETLRKCTNAYYDIYNNGAINPCRFDGLSRITYQSTIGAESKTILINLFRCANRGMVKVDFGGIPSPDFDDFPPDNTFHVQHFERPLEELLDWAILQTWLHHCCG